MSDETDASLAVVITRIEGKLDLLNERHSHSNKAIDNVNERVQGHSTRLNNLEIEAHTNKGEKIGFDKALRGIYALAIAAGTGNIAALAAIAKLFLGH